jgi:hypothetical protein
MLLRPMSPSNAETEGRVWDRWIPCASSPERAALISAEERVVEEGDDESWVFTGLGIDAACALDLPTSTV